ncbi:MAG: hypothetical protein MZV70_42590 [Desulfobacterales bacterium]|nr:hypothetical protein [Desulfobacterales bacterium]
MVFFSLLLSLAIAQAPAPQPVQPAPLTVMSFNIRYGTANDGENHWLKRREHLFALLREQQADVVGLQEALHGQIEEILQAVPGYALRRRGPERRTPGRGVRGDSLQDRPAARAPHRHVLVLRHAGCREVHVVGKHDRAGLYLGVLRRP